MSRIEALIPDKDASPVPNKDLSCLRCRKKKAKCSKTRPACVRCVRSNQSCDYPDAPPTLTNLSEKVLSLYDTLRQLEGEYLVRYMKTMEEEYPTENQTDWNANQGPDIDESSENVSNGSSHLIHPSKRQRQNHPDHNNLSDSNSVADVEEPATWSILLTLAGLTLQTSANTISGLYEFIQEASRQLSRDFGFECLPENWDLDDTEVYEEELGEELDEDSYLVTIPIFPIRALMVYNEKAVPVKKNSKPKAVNPDAAEKIIKANMKELLGSLEALGNNTIFDTIACPQVVVLLRQIQPVISHYSKRIPTVGSVYDNPILYIVICTSYAALCAFGAKTLPRNAPLYTSCVRIATDLLLNIFLQKYDNDYTYLLLVSATLLAWIETDVAEKTPSPNAGGSLIHLCLRVLSGCELQVSSTSWLTLASSLVYLDIYSAIFLQHEPHLGGEASALVLKRLFSPVKQLSNEHESVLLESQLMSFFRQVISLFYHSDSTYIRVKKLDVDILLTLVQDIERWEHSLPTWAKWTNEVVPALAGFKAHMHMIHNMIKILLFRPFCTEFTSPSLGVLMANEQTYTRTTFLDLSTAAADRLVDCLDRLHTSDSAQYWVKAAGGIVRDVLERVQMSFSDEETVDELRKIEERLKSAETKYQSKINHILN